MRNIKYWIWLSIFKFKPKEKIDILKIFEYKPEEIWNSKKEILCKKLIEGKITKSKAEKISEEIISSRLSINLEKLETEIEKNNIKVITCIDNNYPKRLLNTYDYPILLYAKGNIDILNNKCLAIVGCRECTEYGKLLSLKISMSLSENNIIVISGLARGIDTYAHIGCIRKNKPTIAILGSGVDIIYPKENKKVYEEILNNEGVILSEYFLGEEPRKENFPMRNRIVSGMSDGVIVVEAKKRSGSLITAHIAIDQGKEVYSIPRKCNK